MPSLRETLLDRRQLSALVSPIGDVAPGVALLLLLTQAILVSQEKRCIRTDLHRRDRQGRFWLGLVLARHEHGKGQDDGRDEAHFSPFWDIENGSLSS